MAYSQVSLLCGLVAFLLISNGVSARRLDGVSGFARINLNEDSEKKDAANGNSAAAATAQLPSEKSTLAGLAPAPAPTNQISETVKKDEVFDKETFSSTGVDANDIDEDDAEANPGSDSAFEPNGTDDDNTEEDTDDLPLP